MKETDTEFFKIEIAGLKIEVECHYRYVFNWCRRYLAHFDKPDFVVRTSLEEIVANRVEVPDINRNDPDIAMRYADEYIEPFVVGQKIAEKAVSFDAFLMHGAVISTDDFAYIFTAASGVGKSTRAKIWLDEYPGSFIVNGDKPLLKVRDSDVLACGSPWCGNEGWNTNTMVPLKAVFLLERAVEGENVIEEINLGKAFPFLLQQTYRPSDPNAMRKTIELLKALEGKVKFYKFRSTPTSEAIHLAYETARPR